MYIHTALLVYFIKLTTTFANEEFRPSSRPNIVFILADDLVSWF